jgi:DNA-binding Lrp family transcriptional regulator
VRDGILSIASGLSDLDRRLIQHLQRDGRASYASLAAEVGTTEKIVRSRVLSLLSSGIIDITTVTDPRALGYRYVAMIGVRTVAAAMSDVADRLTNLEGVDYVISTMGRYDLIVEIFCRTLNDFSRVIEDGIQATPGVLEVEPYLFLSLVYQEGAFEVAHSKTGRGGRLSGSARVELDQVDVQIVNLLNGDGRTPFRAIAGELDISETQVRRRVARMQEAGALRIMAIANPMSMGFETVALTGVVVAPPVRTQDVAEALSELASVTYVAICAGRFDLWIELVCSDMDEFLQVMDDTIRSIPGIAHLESFIYLDLRYRPVPAMTLHED